MSQSGGFKNMHRNRSCYASCGLPSSVHMDDCGGPIACLSYHHPTGKISSVLSCGQSFVNCTARTAMCRKTIAKSWFAYDTHSCFQHDLCYCLAECSKGETAKYRLGNFSPKPWQVVLLRMANQKWIQHMCR